ncbi:MAG TPA: PLP-dependent aminotransferase family protein [Kofleriaceae bacterium]|nr:PLP-dependent aminotransferase family protein [Kofleriaceae bacterium]
MWSIEARRGAGSRALFARLAAAIAGDIQRGRLRAGDRLPSTRAVARQLGINRNTAVAAYDELAAQGWIVTAGPAGTRVAAELPDRAPRRAGFARDHGVARRPGYELAPVASFHPPGVTPPGVRFLLSAGVPDPRLFPRVALARAYRRALAAPRSNAALDYAEPYGTPRLREAIAALVRTTRAIPAAAENVMITRGSQLALDLVARALVRPGAVAAVEELGYRPAWRALETAGARLAATPLDGSGLVVDALAPRVRCVYLTSHHQYPTTVLLSQPRRAALLARARRERFAIVEDDYDHEFHFDGRPVAPLASADRDGSVIYIGTLSKILAPGLRLGFVIAPEPVIAALGALRTAIDRQGDQVLEHAVAELLEDGELMRHVRKARRIYAQRRAAFAAMLERELGGALDFALPAGGVTLWARVAGDIDLPAWQRRARGRGVVFATAADLALDAKPRPFMRLAFARYEPRELAEAVRVLRATL